MSATQFLSKPDIKISVKQSFGLDSEMEVEGFSKKSNEFLSGRNDNNCKVVFPKANFSKGDYVNVKIKSCTSATLIGEAELNQ